MDLTTVFQQMLTCRTYSSSQNRWSWGSKPPLRSWPPEFVTEHWRAFYTKCQCFANPGKLKMNMTCPTCTKHSKTVVSTQLIVTWDGIEGIHHVWTVSDYSGLRIVFPEKWQPRGWGKNAVDDPAPAITPKAKLGGCILFLISLVHLSRYTAGARCTPNKQNKANIAEMYKTPCQLCSFERKTSETMSSAPGACDACTSSSSQRGCWIAVKVRWPLNATFKSILLPLSFLETRHPSFPIYKD